MKSFLYFIFPLFLMLLPVDFFAENSVFLKFSLDGEFPVNNTDFNIVTKEVLDITCCSAVSGGNFSSTDDVEIKSKGLCWSIQSQPTIEDSKVFSEGTDGDFSVEITNLKANTVYYVRSFVLINKVYYYGDEKEFSTVFKLPTISFSKLGLITDSSFYFESNASDDGGDEITEKGFCFSKLKEPTVWDDKISNGKGLGVISGNALNLMPSTVYFAKAYAISSVGVVYGDEIELITAAKSTIPEKIETNDGAILAKLKTELVEGVTQNEATISVTIKEGGGTDIFEKGVCWAESSSPTINGTKQLEGSGEESFTSIINGLNPSTRYYLRSYAINEKGVAYGNQIIINTKSIIVEPANSDSISLAIVIGEEVTLITNKGAVSGGVISSDGGSEITEKGICWSQSTAPSVYDSKNNEGVGNSAFKSEINSLLPSTKYFVRAYVITSVGVAYGEEFEFVTLPPEVIAQTNTENTENSTETSENNSSEVVKESTEPYLPVIKTNDISSITQTSALSGAVILTEGSTEITEKGICWSQSTAPSVYDSKNNEGLGNSAFNSEINSLLPSTKYFVRSYVITSVGVAYGEELEFVTLSPEVIAETNTENSDEINKNDESSLISVELLTTVKDELTTELTASISCEILRGAELIFSEKGACWSKKELPTIDADKKTEDVDLTYFSVLISDLEPNSLYFVRSYVIFEGKVFYGNQQQFKTLPLTTIPSVSTGLISKINEKSAFSSGQVLLDGGSSLIEKGVCYSFNQMPTIDGDKVIAENELDKFNCSLENLLTNTTYYVRAYAINSLGVAYGNQIRFATLNPVFNKVSSDEPATSLPKKNTQVNPKPTLTKSLPSILTLKEDLLTHSSFRIQGKLTSDGGNFISERGVCISNSSKGPILSSVKTQDIDKDVFSVEFVGLKPSVKYYVRAYVKNETGVFYGNELLVLTNKKPILDIGSNHEGGVIGYIFQPEDKGYVKGEIHGLIVAKEDQGKASWGCVQKSIPEATNKFIGAGKQNTDSILTFCTDDYFAAKLSADLDLNSYVDWYLPSIDELTRIYHNRDKIGGFNNAIYWSSSEKSNHKAIGYVFSYGVVYANYKYSTGYVRSVRTF